MRHCRIKKTKGALALLLVVFFGAVGWLVYPILLKDGDRPVETGRTVHVAFGFHVNLYHSFRNDTNDENGFGKDIRIIRKIIRTLDQYNAKGIAVKGIWDFDNLFSLQEIIPQYAPDIIENIRRRVQKQGDEVILMSYNNGLASAMTREEFQDSVRWSITNPWHSGVRDIFGKYSAIVRPQEMMTTPGNFAIYKENGVQAVALYYSATPFDAFRMFSRPLTRAEAHNPLLYKHPQTREEMVIIPTYHFGDLVEHVSLKHWVRSLRELQNTGELNRDALIFINFDADSELWTGLDVPWFLEWLPATGGLQALVGEIQNLSGVYFTTLGDYLKNHPPVGTFSFSQDTADGSFNGYHSWAEKAHTARYWTTIEHSRQVSAAAQKAMTLFTDEMDTAQMKNLINFAKMQRLRALSTTHFGMATPFIARQRERAMADLMADLDRYADDMVRIIRDSLQQHLLAHPAPLRSDDGLFFLDTLLFLQTGINPAQDGNRFLKIPRPKGYNRNQQFLLIGPDGKIWPAINLGIGPHPTLAPQLSLYLAEKSPITDGIYQLYAVNERKNYTPLFLKGDSLIHLDKTGMSNGRLSICFQDRQIEGIYLDGVRQIQAHSLMPLLKWQKQLFRGQGVVHTASLAADGQSASVRLTGPIPGPKELTLSEGWMDYRLTLIQDRPYLMVQGRIVYPTTVQKDIIKGAAPALVRRTDLNWQETAPLEIQFAPGTTVQTPIRIIKQNYLGVTTEYPLNYFRFSDENLNLDNVNNHITESYVGLIVDHAGMAIGMDTQVQSNFAFAPLRMCHDARSGFLTIHVNPFGTYSGRQYRPPTRGTGNGFDMTLLTGEQFASAAATYNGAVQDFSLLLAFFTSRSMPQKIVHDLKDFTHPPLVFSATARPPVRSPPAPLPPPRGFIAAYRDGDLQFSWDDDQDGENHYRIFCGPQTGHYSKVYPATGNSLRIAEALNDPSFQVGKPYFATIKRISANGQASQPAPEICFNLRAEAKPRPHIPFRLEIRVMWDNLRSWLSAGWIALCHL